MPKRSRNHLQPSGTHTVRRGEGAVRFFTVCRSAWILCISATTVLLLDQALHFCWPRVAQAPHFMLCDLRFRVNNLFTTLATPQL